MLIYDELSLFEFEGWSGGRDTLDALTFDQIEQLQEILEDMYSDGIEKTKLNDILWFDRDWIAEMLNFEDWEHLERVNNGEEWEEVESKDVVDSDGMWTEYTWYTRDDEHIFIFGDRGVYTPYNSDYDHECDSYEEAKEWFECYKGFEEDEE